MKNSNNIITIENLEDLTVGSLIKLLKLYPKDLKVLFFPEIEITGSDEPLIENSIYEVNTLTDEDKNMKLCFQYFSKDAGDNKDFDFLSFATISKGLIYGEVIDGQLTV